MRKNIFATLIIAIIFILGTSIAWKVKGSPDGRAEAFNECDNVILENSEPISDDKVLDLVLCIRNEDIRWSYTYFGLFPVNTSGATRQLNGTEKEIDSMLLDLLEDEDRYVAAHVLLTFRSQERFELGTREWNGLYVQLGDGDIISYEGNNLAALQRYWRGKVNS
jgi:hypothetical protein